MFEVCKKNYDGNINIVCENEEVARAWAAYYIKPKDSIYINGKLQDTETHFNVSISFADGGRTETGTWYIFNEAVSRNTILIGRKRIEFLREQNPLSSDLYGYSNETDFLSAQIPQFA